MFCAVNTESEAQKRLVKAEAETIRKMYFTALNTLNIEPILSFIPVHDKNHNIYRQAKANLLYGYAKRTPIECLNLNAEKFELFSYKHVLFVIAGKNIASGNFVRGRKLLNLAKVKGWYCNTLYNLQKKIDDEYYGTGNNSIHIKLSCSHYKSRLLMLADKASFD